MIQILMNKDYSSLLDLLDITGGIEGRTKFQKIVFILQSKGFPFSFKYKYHFFGPYSSDLQLGIEELVDNNIVEEDGSDPYTYTLLENATKKENIFSINKKFIDYLNNADFRILELVSTIIYLKEIGYKDKKTILTQLEILKPNLSNKFDNAFTYYKAVDIYKIQLN